MILCEFVKGRRGHYCKACGRQSETGSPAIRECAHCPHLGSPVWSGGRRGSEPRPLTIKVACTTCNGRKQVDQPVYSCDLFGRCLPGYHPTPEQRAEYLSRPDAIAAICQGCDRRDC